MGLYVIPPLPVAAVNDRLINNVTINGLELILSFSYIFTTQSLNDTVNALIEIGTVHRSRYPKMNNLGTMMILIIFCKTTQRGSFTHQDKELETGTRVRVIVTGQLLG